MSSPATTGYAQVGVNLTLDRGGVAKAVDDYRNAAGGAVFSILSANLPLKNTLSHAEYFRTAPEPWNIRMGRLTRETATRFVHELQSCEHVGLHGSYRHTGEYLRRATNFSRTLRFSYIPHGSLDPWVFKKNRLLKNAWLASYGRLLLKKSTNVIAATTSELRKIQRIAGCLPNQKVIPLPVDVVQRPTEEQRQIARQRLALPNSARVLLYLGRLHPMKRPAETIQLVCAHSSKDIHLIVAGPEDGISLAKLTALVSRYDAKQRIKIVGPAFGQSKLSLFFAADAFISLSHRENFNYAAAESLSLGIPVILSPGNDIAEDLMSVKCGWMLPSVSEKCVHDALTDFAELQVVEQREMGCRGRNWANDELHPSRFVDNVQKAFSR